MNKKPGNCSLSSRSTGHRSQQSGTKSHSPKNKPEQNVEGDSASSSAALGRRLDPAKFRKYINLCSNTEDDTESSKPSNSSCASSENKINSSPNNEQEQEVPHSNAEDALNMHDYEYPLRDELAKSDQARQLDRERIIDEVIQEQAQMLDMKDHEVQVPNVAQANLRRVYEVEDNSSNCEPEPSALRQSLADNSVDSSLSSATNSTATCSSDTTGTSSSFGTTSTCSAETTTTSASSCGSFSYVENPLQRAETAIANYMMKKFGGQQSHQFDDAGPSCVENTSSKNDTGRAVNILPASRNLELPVNNLIAIGCRPSRKSSSSTIANGRAANADVHPCGWQATKSSLKERLGYMFCNNVLADVYFIVGREESVQRIPAHKFVLSIGSVVFDAMFNGGFTPENSKEALEIELPDVEPSAFLTLLRFLYTDEVNIGPESVMTTLYTAKKYAVPAMESACVEFLKESLGADNAFMLLTQARLFDEPQLELLCLELIDKNTSEALSGEGFTDIDIDTLCSVLRRDTLRVRESVLFQAVVRWSSEECRRRGMEPNVESKRSVLGPALQLIRFPLMTIEEFAQTAGRSGLLDDKEVVQLFLYFTLSPKPAIRYAETPRCSSGGKELMVGRFQRNEVRWGYSGVPDRIKFTVDRKIYVIGFGLYGGITGPQEYPVTIQIIHCGTGKVMAQNETAFTCDGSPSTFRVSFREPVEITPSVTYIASAFLKGADSHYGTKGLRRIVHQSTAGTVTFQFTYAAGNNNGTSVEDGQIPEIYFYL